MCDTPPILTSFCVRPTHYEYGSVCARGWNPSFGLTSSKSRPQSNREQVWDVLKQRVRSAQMAPQKKREVKNVRPPPRSGNIVHKIQAVTLEEEATLITKLLPFFLYIINKNLLLLLHSVYLDFTNGLHMNDIFLLTSSKLKKKIKLFLYIL